MGLQEERRVVVLLRQGEELFGQLTGALQVPPHIIKPPEATQHRAELTGVSQLLAQAPAPGCRRVRPPGRQSPLW